MISRYVERMLPKQYRGADADTLRRARLVLFFQAVFFLYVPFPTLSNAAAGNWAAVGALLAAYPILALMPTMLRRSVALAGNYTAGMFFLVVGILGYFLGGPASANWWFLPLTPMLAMLLAGRTSAWRWALVTLAAGGAVTVLTIRGFAWPPALEMPKRQVFWAVTFLGTTVVLYALTSLYEHAKEMMRVELAKANAEMRLVLDSVGQGFMTVDANGQISEHHSAILERWFGPIGERAAMWTWLAPVDDRFALALELGWEQLFGDWLPTELTLAQLPARLTMASHTYELAYKPVLDDAGKLAQVIVVVSDITNQLEAERAEMLQRELIVVFERIGHDRTGFLQFWDEASAIVRQLRAGTAASLRLLHTLKGNCQIFGVRSVATPAHALEGKLQDTREPATADDIATVAAAWDAFAARVSSLVRADGRHMQIPMEDYEELANAIREHLEHLRLSEMIEKWRYERTEQTFERMAEQGRSLAVRLQKAPLVLELNHNDVRLDPERFSPLWAAFVHAVRNAIDHGLETPAERQQAGKAEAARITLSSRLDGMAVIIEIADNGRGIDWARVRDMARAAGLPHGSSAELEAVLFTDGVSTKDEITEVSGRGVGLGALRQICQLLDGSIAIHSDLGRGTRLTIRVPISAQLGPPPPPNPSLSGRDVDIGVACRCE
jgi:signal transduction histidine kinase